MPPYLISKLPKAQELLDEGKTDIEIAWKTGISTRTLSRWKSAGWLIRPSLSPVELARTDALEHAPEQDWTARDLLELGMEPAEAARNLLLLENTATVSSPRYREWLSKYIPLAAKMPDEWAAAVAFLPILGRDLCNPALGALAELMHESVPWRRRPATGTLRWPGQASVAQGPKRIPRLVVFRGQHRNGARSPTRRGCGDPGGLAEMPPRRQAGPEARTGS